MIFNILKEKYKYASTTGLFMNVDLETGLGTFFLAFITSLFLGWFFVIFTKESTLFIVVLSLSSNASILEALATEMQRLLLLSIKKITIFIASIIFILLMLWRSGEISDLKSEVKWMQRTLEKHNIEYDFQYIGGHD